MRITVSKCPASKWFDSQLVLGVVDLRPPSRWLCWGCRCSPLILSDWRGLNVAETAKIFGFAWQFVESLRGLRYEFPQSPRIRPGSVDDF